MMLGTMHSRLAVAGLVASLLASTPVVGDSAGFTLAEAKQVYDSAHSALSYGFASPRQRHVSWAEDGNLRVAREPEFAPRTLVTRSDEASVVAVLPSDGSSIFFMRQRKQPAALELWQIDDERGGEPTLIASPVRPRFIAAP